MDCPANHRYHSYAPPANTRYKRFIGNHEAPFSDGYRGGRQSRYQRGRRGTGNMLRPMNRDDLYQPHHSHTPVNSSKGHLDSRYHGPQQKASPSWYQGRSMNYGLPRPPANYYFQRNTRVHYRGGGYSPPPRFHPKSMRPACTSPTGSSFPNAKSLSPTPCSESPQFKKNLTASMTSSASSLQQANQSAHVHRHPKATITSDTPTLLDKQSVSTDIKNPSVVKVAPFSHQPSPNSSKSLENTSLSSTTLDTSSSETVSQIKPEYQVALPCNAGVSSIDMTEADGSQISIGTPPCLASKDGIMTVFAPAADGQMRPICRTICSCQLRKRAMKYVDKGKTKDDSIVIDSDEEGDYKSNEGVDSGNKQEEHSESFTPVKDTTSGLGQSSCQDSPRKRAKMSTDNALENSSSVSSQPVALITTEASTPQSPITESVAQTVSRVVDGLRQSLGEGWSSSTSLDSSSVISAHVTEEHSESFSPVKDTTSGLGQSSFQDSPRKRAKMSTDNALENSQPVALVTTEASSPHSPITESVAETVSRVVDGLRQSLGEGWSGSTSSDSSSVISAHVTDDAQLLGDPQILRGILSICKETSKPLKKFKTSPRNLYTAAKDCNIQKVISLLAEGCDPNQQLLKAKGKTAIHAAAAGGYVDIIACLRLAGCDLNLVDYENRTPIFDAVNNHKVKAVEYLIECGAVLGTKDSEGMTCFHLATRQGHTDLIKLLLKTRKFDINEKDDGGWTPIMWAAENKQFDATQLLIEQGANVHIRDEELNVPLHWAAVSGNLEVCKLLLEAHADIDSLNVHKETALHIAAREDNYDCVKLFVGRGANIHIRNKRGETPLGVAELNTKSTNLLQSKLDLESCQEFIRPRILHSDISRGQENVSISCINEVDDEPFPEFTFVKESCEIYNGTINWSISKFEGCECDGDCRSGRACRCAKRSEQHRIWYNEEGLLKGDLQKYDRPPVFECNKMCNCWSYCNNRVVQKGMQYPLQLYRTYRKGWGVRSLAEIQQGSFVCEYTGELISDMEADARDDDSYLFDLDCKKSVHELYCIDAKHYGNISRFINHSCEPNVFPIRVFIHHRDMRFPRIAFFATKDINIHDEICFNYGDRFWSVKKKEFYCECDTPSCKYGDPNR